MNITDREGKTHPYDEQRVRSALLRAFDAADEFNTSEIDSLVERVEYHLKQLDHAFDVAFSVTLDQIQREVEDSLMSHGYTDVARCYIEYRAERDRQRNLLLTPDPLMLPSYIHAAKYARGGETYDETVRRVLDMHLRRFEHLGPEFCAEIHGAFKHVSERRVLSSMRSMQFAGPAIERNNARIYNCTFTHIDRIDVFGEIFWLLLCGCGCGYSVQWRHVNRLPVVESLEGKVNHWCVEDTIEGWADALKALMYSYLGDGEGVWPHRTFVEFDYSYIRHEGLPLETSGGRAPGHLPLKKVLETIRDIMDNAVGRSLRPIECHDIVCHIALGVLAGGIRRSSLIALFSPEDTEMMYSKARGVFSPEGANRHRMMANNTCVFLRGTTDRDAFDRIGRLSAAGFGEPGFLFVSDLDHGINPCSEIGFDPVYREPVDDTSDSDDVNVKLLHSSVPGEELDSSGSELDSSGEELDSSGSELAESWPVSVSSVSELLTDYPELATVAGELGYNTSEELAAKIDIVIRAYNLGDRGLNPIPWPKIRDSELVANDTEPVNVNSSSEGVSASGVKGFKISNGSDSCGPVAGADVTSNGLTIDGVKLDSSSVANLLVNLDPSVASSDEELESRPVSEASDSELDSYVSKLSASEIYAIGQSLLNVANDEASICAMAQKLVAKLSLDSKQLKAKVLVEELNQESSDGVPVSSDSELAASDSKLDSCDPVSSVFKKAAQLGFDSPEILLANANRIAKEVDPSHIDIELSDLEQELELEQESDSDSDAESEASGDLTGIESGGRTIDSFGPVVSDGDPRLVSSDLIPASLDSDSCDSVPTPVTGFGFCNLCEVNVAACDGDSFVDACRAAAFIGTLQANYTSFSYLAPASGLIARRDALIGVSLTGIMDNVAVGLDAGLLTRGAGAVVAENRRVASIIGIRAAARATCIKPSGTASLVLGTCAGIHGHHASHYFRRVTVNPLEDVVKFFGNTHMIETKPDGDLCIVFPVCGCADSGDQLARIRLVYKNWVAPGGAGSGPCNNVSCTVTTSDPGAVSAWAWDNRDWITAMATAPPILDYPYAPLQAVVTEADKALWHALVSGYVAPDWSSFKGSVLNRTLTTACAGGACRRNI